MTIASLPNLAAVAVQIACVALLAGALIWALRITSAGLSYALWRGVFVVCLVLPWMQTPRSATVLHGAVLAPETAAAVVSGAVSDASPAVPVDWSRLIVLASRPVRPFGSCGWASVFAGCAGCADAASARETMNTRSFRRGWERTRRSVMPRRFASR